MHVSVGSAHIPKRKRKGPILWCDIYIPSGWMFNLLWRHDMTGEVTGTWNFHVTCGFRERRAYNTRSPIRSLQGGRLEMCSDHLPGVRSFSPRCCFTSLINCLSWRKCLFNYDHHTDVCCRRAFLIMEGFFSRLARMHTGGKVEQISAWIHLGQKKPFVVQTVTAAQLYLWLYLCFTSPTGRSNHFL